MNTDVCIARIEHNFGICDFCIHDDCPFRKLPYVPPRTWLDSWICDDDDLPF